MLDFSPLFPPAQGGARYVAYPSPWKFAGADSMRLDLGLRRNNTNTTNDTPLPAGLV
jgi:hypothetical protein